MHEHVFIMTTEIMENYPQAWGDGAKREADAIARLNELKSRGVRIVGLAETAADSLAATDLSGPLALVVGSEGRGLSKAVARRECSS